MPPELLQEMLEKAATHAVERFAEKHPCRLTDDERSMIHSQHESMLEEGANHGTWRVIIQMGRSWQDVTKRVRNAGILLLLVLLGALAIKVWK